MREWGGCFITGAAGFIGSHLTERLLAEGNRVTGFDNLSSGREENLLTAQSYADFRLIRGDLSDESSLRDAMRGHDTVFHLAANGDIRAAIQDPTTDLNQGVTATLNVLKVMRHVGARQIIFTSSGSVFGTPDAFPASEEVGPLLPMSFYAAAKAAAEAFISAAANLFGITAWIFRLGNVVGGRMTRGVVYDFITKLRRDAGELEILGDGEQRKSYILVEECIDGMLTGSKDDSHITQVFNLSTPDTLTVREVAEIVVEEMGLRDVRFRYTGGKGGWPGDQPVAILDMKKMSNLGWLPGSSSAQAVSVATRRILGQSRSDDRKHTTR